MKPGCKEEGTFQKKEQNEYAFCILKMHSGSVLAVGSMKWKLQVLRFYETSSLESLEWE